MQNKFRKALAGRIYPLRLLGDRQTFRSTIVTDVQRHLQTQMANRDRFGFGDLSYVLSCRRYRSPLMHHRLTHRLEDAKEDALNKPYLSVSMHDTSTVMTMADRRQS